MVRYKPTQNKASWNFILLTLSHNKCLTSILNTKIEAIWQSATHASSLCPRLCSSYFPFYLSYCIYVYISLLHIIYKSLHGNWLMQMQLQIDLCKCNYKRSVNFYSNLFNKMWDFKLVEGSTDWLRPCIDN